ncbi:LytR/AlgR family response regulator transcription factor [Rhodohalobacter sp. 8-1]|uniref:LytR/AlgR family response regulator transcription factor n=1 Tax=Rhodohalobacter sp. 8-1 TaxID=3131972 RepID=UPI0030EDD925
MMTCLIIDDEPVARDILRTYISDTPQLTLTGECESAVAALSILKEQSVDLIFLDINMPKLSGISFLKSLPAPPKVILTTAYSEYALESYELDVVDYLLKPFSFERFLKAVNKVPEPSGNDDAYVVIKADGKTYRINEKDILFAESQGDYITLHTREKRHTFNQTLKSFSDELTPSDFLRVHKSYLIALRQIDYVEGNMIHINGHDIPLGKVYKDEFRNRFIG